MEKNCFKAEEIEKFVKDHVQSKIDHHEIGMIGFDTSTIENFARELEIYQNTLFEGICNGIVLCGGKVEGIDLD